MQARRKIEPALIKWLSALSAEEPKSDALDTSLIKLSNGASTIQESSMTVTNRSNTPWKMLRGRSKYQKKALTIICFRFDLDIVTVSISMNTTTIRSVYLETLFVRERRSTKLRLKVAKWSSSPDNRSDLWFDLFDKKFKCLERKELLKYKTTTQIKKLQLRDPPSAQNQTPTKTSLPAEVHIYSFRTHPPKRSHLLWLGQAASSWRRLWTCSICKSSC